MTTDTIIDRLTDRADGCEAKRDKVGYSSDQLKLSQVWQQKAE